MLQVESTQPQTLADKALTNGTAGRHTSRSAHVVDEIRARFFREELPVNKELYAEEDIELIQKSEWFVKRFLLAAYRNSDVAYKNLRDTLRWRKEVGLHTVKPSDFPSEFFEVGGLFPYECDRDGSPVIFLRIRMHRKIKELFEPVQQFLFWNVFCVDQNYGHKGAVIVFDCQGMGYSNVDMDMLKSISDIAYKYFPYAVKYIIVYELPWVLNAVRKLAMSVIPSSMVALLRFVNKNEITQYIPPEHLPDYMGGTCTRDYQQVPGGCKSVEELAIGKGFSKEDIERILPPFQPLLKEAREAKEKRKQLIKYEPMKEMATTPKVIIETEIKKETTDMALNDFETKSIAIVYRSSDSYTTFASIYPQNVLKFNKTPLQRTMNEDGNETILSSKWTTTIVLRNNDNSKLLAFKMQSNHPEHYTVTPSEGVLLPGVFICLRIVLKTNVKNVSSDKFLLLLHPNVQMNDGMDTRMFAKMFTKQVDQVHSHKFFVDIETINKDENSLADKNRSINVKEDVEAEVKRLKRKYKELFIRQRWYNYLLLLFFGILFLLLLVGYLMNTNHFSMKANWISHWSNWMVPLASSIQTNDRMMIRDL